MQYVIGEYVRGDAHTQRVKAFRLMLKRAHKGMFHHMSAKHLHRNVNNFSGWLNIRNADPLVFSI